jgi:predicted nuclease of predicted toxin-antitoxin system
VRFLLDNDVDHAVASLLRTLGHTVVVASEVGLGGVEPASDDEVTVYATNRDMTVVTHDREFTARRKRHTIGLHVRLMCAQPDAVDVLRERHEELLDVLSWTDTAVVEVYRTSVRHHPPRWD